MNALTDIGSWDDRRPLPTWVECGGWDIKGERSKKVERLRQVAFTRNHLLTENYDSDVRKGKVCQIKIYCIHRYWWREDGFLQVGTGWGYYSSFGWGMRRLRREERDHQQMTANFNEIFGPVVGEIPDSDVGISFISL